MKESVLKTLEIIPVIGFGIAYWKYDLQVATMVMVVLTTLFVAIVKLSGAVLTKLQLVTWLVILILGGATVLFRDETYIKWKTTIINSMIALLFLGSQLFMKESISEKLIGEKISAPKRLLRRFNLSCGIYFLFIASLNIYIANNFDTTIWVNFKLFGIMVLNMCFFGTWIFIMRDYLKEFIEQNSEKK